MGQHGTLRGVAIRNRLCPGGAQEAVLVRHCGDARYVWNLAVGQQSYFVKGGAARPPGPVQRQRQLAEIRKDTWLAGGSSSVQQQALRDFGRALAAFFGQANPAGKPIVPAEERAARFRRPRYEGPAAQPEAGRGVGPQARLGAVPLDQEAAGRAGHGARHPGR